MQMICVSRGSQSRGEEFAQKLAAKLDYECVSREQLLEEATKRRIPIGKLETAIIKPHTFTEDLAYELEYYKALSTSILCEKALSHNIVYHGRTGHLLLPGISHILKIRVESDAEYRIQYIMQKLQLSRQKAKRYLEQVDDDRRRWVKTFYNVEWNVFSLYDLVINLSQVNVDNSATAICHMAQLPEFQATPASMNALKDLYLASRARLLLASDRRTSRMNIKVKVSDRVLYVTYLLQQIKHPEIINEVLSPLKEAREIVCTKAQTNILWIQEKFEIQEEEYKGILSLANTWDAAVELMKMTPDEKGEMPTAPAIKQDTESWRQTGIIDESEEAGPPGAPDLSKIYEKLIGDGRAGGKRSVTGSQKTLMNAIDRSVNYRLIVFDNMFAAKDPSARKRLLQEWSNVLTESLQIPVVTMKELKSEYRFGASQLVRMLTAAILTALIIFLLFKSGPQIVSVLSNADSKVRIISTICILIFVPLFAYIYSTVTGLLLKMIKLE